MELWSHHNQYIVVSILSKKMDETGIEPVTFCLQGRRATNYATRPFYTELILENK